MPRNQLFLSLVVVVQDWSAYLEAWIGEATRLLAKQCTDYEVIVVDNGSQDDSVAVLRRLAHIDGVPNLQVFTLTKPVDNDLACWVGVGNALGDSVAVIDPTVDDVAFLEHMVEAMQGGASVVFARNLAAIPQNLGYRLCARLLKWLSGIDAMREIPTYRLISRDVVNHLQQYGQPELMYRWLPATAGFTKANLVYRGASRRCVRRPLTNTIDRAIRLLVTSANAPMRLVTSLTLFGALANLLYSFYVIAIALLKDDVAPGWITLSLQQSGMFFLISLVLLVLSEYILHMATLSNKGPRYHIAQEFTSVVLTRCQRLNVDDAQPSEQEATSAPKAPIMSGVG